MAGVFDLKNVDRRTAIGCTSIILALGLGGVIWWTATHPDQPLIGEGGGGSAQLQEGAGDCFIPKEGPADCVIDIIDVEVDRPTYEGRNWPLVPEAAANGCEPIRATLTFDTELVALDLQRQGEVVIQVHPSGGTSDGSADTGVGVSRFPGGTLREFSFGPGGINPAPGAVSAQWVGRTATLQVNSFAGGSCIEDGSELRIKAEMTNAAGERIYDIVGTSELMQYFTIENFLDSFGSN